MRVFPQPVVEALTRTGEQQAWHVDEAAWHLDRSSSALERALTALDADAVRSDSMVRAARDSVAALKSSVDQVHGADDLLGTTLLDDIAAARRTQPLVDGA